MRPATTVLLLAAALLALPHVARGAALDPRCGLPFGDKAVARTIDAVCPAEGARAKTWSNDVWAANRLENLAKNNFCAPGPARTITIAQLVDLQHRAEALREQGAITYGDEKRLPADRAPLRELGEGTRVRYVGYIVEAHDAKPGLFGAGGESCNCLRRGRQWNDIHVTLADSPDAAACDGFVAEMSPHYRPWLWHDDMLRMAGRRPVVVIGQLFFDSDHEPCGEGPFTHPKRISLWEIHPIYEFLVCRHEDAAACPIEDAGAWIPLDEWTGE